MMGKQVLDFNRLFDLIPYQCSKYPNSRALNYLQGTHWISCSIDAFRDRVNALSIWFLDQGFTRGEKILIVPQSGHPDWMIIDFACQQTGLILVPVHPSARAKELKFILEETQARLCICFNPSLVNKMKEAAGPQQEEIRLMHLQKAKPGYFNAIENQTTSEDDLARLELIKSAISDQDVFTIMYTSGSTGIPKGIMLSHANVVFNIKTILYLMPLEPQWRVISFLPFSHIFERVTCYAYLANGVSVYFSQVPERFVRDFKEIRPHFCTCVPRVLEKMINYVEEQKLKRNRLQRILIQWALEIGEQYVAFDREFKPIYRIKLTLARWLVLDHWKKILGGKLKFMVVGAAALQPRISQLLSAANIQIAEAYGMTEAAPIISINRFEPGGNLPGTVGRPVPGIEVRIDQPDQKGEGEILVRGPNITKGYYNNPELTRETIDQGGWLHTGDIGQLVEHQFLKITDRKKDIFKTSAGVYIAPQPLQLHYCLSPFILRCLIIGFQRPYITALIVPDFALLHAWCEREKIHWTAPQFMVHNIKVRDKLQDEINQLSEPLANTERIRNFILCEKDWSVEEGELTASFKPIRQNLMDHYQKEIDQLYVETHP